jgi:hypothetical protein
MALRRLLDQAQGKAGRDLAKARLAPAIATTAFFGLTLVRLRRQGPQLPLLQRGAVVGQLESSRQATHRPLLQYGAVVGQDVASVHCAQWPR